MAGQFNYNDIVEVTIEQTLYDQTVLNVLHFQWVNQSVSPPITSTFDAMFDEMTGAGDLIPLMKAAQSEDLVHDRITFQKIKAQRYARYAKPTGGPGQLNTAAGVANTAAVITKRTELARDKGVPFAGQVGGFHLAGIPTDVFEQGYLVGNYVTGALKNVAEWIPALFTNPDIADMVPVLYHRKVQTGKIAELIIEAYPESTARVMRRRTVGLGI